MGIEYWIGRQQAALGMARAASTAEARLIHYDLSGRYAVKAGQGAPFMLPRKGPATAGERAVLHLPRPPIPLRPPRQAAAPGFDPGPAVRR